METQSQIVFRFTHRMMSDTSLSWPKFALSVREHYEQAMGRVPVGFRFSGNPDIDKRMRVDAQTIRRFEEEHDTPEDLLVSMVMVMRTPYKELCLAALADRFDGVFVPRLQSGDAGQSATLANFHIQVGEAITQLTRMIESKGRIGPEDRGLADKALQELDDVGAAVAALKMLIYRDVFGETQERAVLRVV